MTTSTPPLHAAIDEPLDALFHALANPTRRAVVDRLTSGPAAVTELAAPFDMALPSFLQHLRVLESCALVESVKRGRVRTVRLRPETLRTAEGWLARRRAEWERRLDQLDDYLIEMAEQEST